MNRSSSFSLVFIAVACCTILACICTHTQAATTPTPTHSDPSLIQSSSSSQARSKVHTYSAAAARASLHAGERASVSRFDSVTKRVGIEVPHHASKKHRRGDARQNHQAEHEQQVMLSVVEKVLNSQEQESASAHENDGSMEGEFHLLNALMEKQSEMREYAKDSNEKEHIAGVSRKFLRDVTDSAIKNALSKLQKQHPNTPMHTAKPVHVYGVRSPYNGDRQNKYDRHSEAALKDPYLSRNSFMDIASQASGFARRSRPQVVYRLGKHDSQLLTERENQRNEEYSQAHQRRRNSPTPRPTRRASSKPAAKRASASAGKKGEKVSAASFLEFETLQKAYVAEMEAHALASEEANQPWFVHAHPSTVAESHTASKPLSQLFDDFAPHADKEQKDAVLLEVETELQSEAAASEQSEQMPLKELGILLGLNMEKRNIQPDTQHQQVKNPQQQQQKTSTPAQPRFAQVKHKSKHTSGAAASHVLGGLASAGVKGDDEEGGGGDDLDAMVNAGEAYKPSTLKHPPPPPVPPPPPPPPPPKFSA